MSADFVATKNLTKPRREARKRLKARISAILDQLADFGDEYRDAKVREALEWKRQATPDIEQFPLINAAAQRSGKTPIQVANQILAVDLQWRNKLAAIENILIESRQNISAGRNAQQIDAAVEAAMTALDSAAE